MRHFSLITRLSLALLAALPLLAAAQTATLPPRMKLVIDGHKLPADSYGFYVQQAGDGPTLLSVNPNHPLNPASTMKVLTTLAALEQLGPEFTWNTRVYAQGELKDGTLNGDLLIKGGGDPYLLEDQVRNMLKALQRTGIKRISGDLVLDTSYFAPEVAQDSPIDNQSERAYNVLPNALMSNFQAVTFYFRPAADGKHVVIDADPKLANLDITNNLRLKPGACEGYQRGVRFNEDEARNEHVTFSGDFPAGCHEFALVRAVMTPEQFFYGLFTQLWRELGGEFAGKLRLAAVPADSKPLLVWTSPPLSEVIRSINKYSNNLMTRQTLLTLGAERYTAPATVSSGANVVGEYLQMLGIDGSPLVVANGSGLARESRITAGLMNQVLQHGQRSPFMAEFIASLPINGIDGTMRNRLRAGPMRGNMHVKTGTLDQVSAVAGYVTAKSGKQYTVVGLLNHDQADRGPGVELMDALLAWVFEQ
ncbi:MAG TPA: D-alanyl-D-alanine carboxypeptidase/D-alanyl-D-alanine-endopeptidase [Candidatus Acidoferrum sp.]|nr:D-alanyl-D-alanine carboxypeptidase/D-alanyl-D-alanine-endopeptidase [Candidatus Acidoferrum sp.]